ncbi:unnamed protein product [Oikopleura dioica]|uniref:Uncharacterized protein n=1 Tax=Oikopleura dioica TaxID=34765 RepID=E4Z751_OIKDI|nr:unnamed protein product [Oikopleura dioica]
MRYFALISPVEKTAASHKIVFHFFNEWLDTFKAKFTRCSLVLRFGDSVIMKTESHLEDKKNRREQKVDLQKRFFSRKIFRLVEFDGEDDAREGQRNRNAKYKSDCTYQKRSL